MKIEHSYPHCWRCHTPLLYYARESWYIKTSAHKKDLMKNNDKINWYPPEVGCRRRAIRSPISASMASSVRSSEIFIIATYYDLYRDNDISRHIWRLILHFLYYYNSSFFTINKRFLHFFVYFVELLTYIFDFIGGKK